jgi:hypothetical protein
MDRTAPFGKLETETQHQMASGIKPRETGSSSLERDSPKGKPTTTTLDAMKQSADALRSGKDTDTFVSSALEGTSFQGDHLSHFPNGIAPASQSFTRGGSENGIAPSVLGGDGGARGDPSLGGDDHLQHFPNGIGPAPGAGRT